MGMLIIGLLFGLLMAVVARRKGYNPLLWFFAAGLIGLVVLLILPDLDKVSAAERDSKRTTGNIVGGVLSAAAIVFGAIRFLAV